MASQQQKNDAAIVSSSTRASAASSTDDEARPRRTRSSSAAASANDRAPDESPAALGRVSDHELVSSVSGLAERLQCELEKNRSLEALFEKYQTECTENLALARRNSAGAKIAAARADYSARAASALRTGPAEARTDASGASQAVARSQDRSSLEALRVSIADAFARAHMEHDATCCRLLARVEQLDGRLGACVDLASRAATAPRHGAALDQARGGTRGAAGRLARAEAEAERLRSELEAANASLSAATQTCETLIRDATASHGAAQRGRGFRRTEKQGGGFRSIAYAFH